MKFPKLRFSLWTLLWLAVLIGAAMGMYAKREPWRLAWEVNCPEPAKVRILWNTRNVLMNTVWVSWPRTSYGTLSPHPFLLDLNTGSLKPVPSSSEQEYVAISPSGAKLLEYVPLPAWHVRSMAGRVIQADGSKTDLKLKRFWRFQGEFTPDGKYVACWDDNSLSINKVEDGSCIFHQDLKTKLGFYAGAQHYSTDLIHHCFHPQYNRILIRTWDELVEEWDLESGKKTRAWWRGELVDPNGTVVPEPPSTEISVVDYLQNGNIFFRTYHEKGGTIRCATFDGFERWKFSSERNFWGERGFYENDVAMVDEGEKFQLTELSTHKTVIMNSVPLAIFPDRERCLADATFDTVADSEIGIVELRTQKLIRPIAGFKECYSDTEDPYLIDNDHVLAFHRTCGIFSYFERARPEYWWGWFYVPETYIAALAVGCLLTSLINFFRAKNKLDA